MDWFLDPGDERRQASDKTRDLLLDAAAALGAHHIKVGNIPGTPAVALAALRAVRRAVRRRRRAHGREDRLRVHAVRHERQEHRRGARGRRRSGAAERGHRDRHLAHVEARDRARRPPSDPARVHELDRAERRAVRGHGRPDRRGHQPSQPPGRGRVRREGLHRASARITATQGRGVSRRSPRSFATTRSTSSSGGPTRRPPPSSHRRKLNVSAPEGRSSTATGSSGCTTRCCGSASSRSGSSARSSSIPA